MKICIYFENYIAGGVDSVIVNKINNWPSQDDQFILVCNLSHEGLKKIIKAKINKKIEIIDSKILSLKVLAENNNKNIFFKKIIVKFLLNYLRYIYILINFIKLKKIIYQIKPCVIFIHNGGYPGGESSWSAALASFYNNVDVFNIIHNIAVPIKKYNYIFDKLLDTLTCKICKNIVVSQNSKKSLIKIRKFYNEILVINNGTLDYSNKIPHDKFLYEKYFDKNKIIVGSIGVLEKRKGHHILIEAINLLVQEKIHINYLLFGNGNVADTEYLAQLITSYNLDNNVFLLGFNPNAAMYIKYFDIFIHPSINYESFPMSILEAMSSKVPIIASKVGGVNEMLKNNHNGIIVKSGDVHEIKNAIIKIKCDTKFKSKIIGNARMDYENKYTSKVMSNKYYNLVKN